MTAFSIATGIAQAIGRSTAQAGAGGGAFDPLTLFAGGEAGAWYDPSDLSSMFQDSAGTVAVTAAGQPVGRINDKSGRGNHATQTTAGDRPLLQQDGAGNYYLANDGAGDHLLSGASAEFGPQWEFWISTQFDTGAGIFPIAFAKATSAASNSTSGNVQGLFQRSDGVQRTMQTASRIGVGTSVTSILLSAFVLGAPFTARGVAGLSPDELRTTANGSTNTTAATYAGTPATNSFCLFASGAVAQMRIYGAVAVARALTAGEADELKIYMDELFF